MFHTGPLGVWCTNLYKQYFQKNALSLLPSILHYLNDKNVFEHQYTSQFKRPLEFWSYARAEHSELADLATVLLKVSPHAAGVERLWSRMKGVHTDARNLMKVDLVTGACAVKMQLTIKRNKEETARLKKLRVSDGGIIEVIQTRLATR